MANMNVARQIDWELLEFKKQTFNLILLDGPYEINYNNREWDKPNSIDWGFLFLMSKIWLKNNGNVILFTGWSNLKKMLTISSSYFNLQNIITWDRVKTRRAKDKNLTSASEFILWFTKKNLEEKNIILNKEDSLTKKSTSGMGHKNGSRYRRLSNVWTDIPPIVPWSEEYTGYDCQKPLALIRRIIRLFSNPSDTIGDFFCGSGTTAEASIIEKRNYFCSDINSKAIEITNNRIKKYT